MVYQASGLVVAFDDGSVATGIYTHTGGGLNITGFTPAQAAAVRRYNSKRGVAADLDPRLGDANRSDFADGQVAVWDAEAGRLVGRGGRFGGASYGVKTVTADYTLTARDYTVRVDSGSAPVAVTLPPASSLLGCLFVVKKVGGSGAVALAASPGDLIDGNQSVQMDMMTSLTVQSNGTSWDIL